MKARLPGLDGLRTISISLVVIDHLHRTAGFPMHFAFHRAYFGDLGLLGVRVFFVISGYLITHLLVEELRTNGSISIRDFYIRRAIRIIPALAILLLALAIADVSGWTDIARTDWIHALTFTMDYSQTPSFSIGHLWSLSVEEQFYVLWPAALAFLGKARALTIAVGAVLFLPFTRVFIFHAFPAYRPYADNSFETVADALAIGCVLALTREHLATTRLYRAVMGSSLFMIIAPIILLFANGTEEHPTLNMLVMQSLMNVLIAGVIEWTIVNPHRAIGRFLDHGVMRFIGVRSYSIYLWQEPFLDHRHLSTVTAFPFNIILAVATAFGSYQFIERPMMKLRSKLTRS